MEAATLNHLKSHWYNFLLKWCKRKVHLYNLTATDKMPNNFPYRLLNLILKGGDPELLHSLGHVVNEWVEFYQSLVAKRNDIMEKWRIELYIMYQLLMDVEIDSPLNVNYRKSLFRKFRLLPIFTLKCDYLT